jgi:radical SAM superfamily enzyme YgiQ (UPF0313 family)
MRDINLLLINPWLFDFKAYDLWMKPLGLFMLASVLVREDYRIHYIDCLDRSHSSIPGEFRESSGAYGCGSYYSEEVPKPEMYRKIPRKYKRYGIPLEAFWTSLQKCPVPDAILITSSMTYWYPGPFKAIEMVKEFFPETPVILGGIYCRLCPEHALRHSGGDFLVSSGEIDDLLATLSNITGRRHRFSYGSPADYPPPLYDFGARFSYLPLLTSYGCPFRCVYCASSVLAPVRTPREPARLFDEVRIAHQQRGVRDITFYDDALLVDFHHHLKKLLTLCIEHNLHLRFHTPNALHASMIDGETALLLKRAGFQTIRLGFEVSDPLMQAQTGGKVTTEDMKRALHNLHEAGFDHGQIGAYIMCGLPGVSFERISEAISIIHGLRAMSRIVEFSPLPGTTSWEAFPGASTEESKDPLFHNNTYHTYRGTVLPYEEYRELKKMSQRLNESLRKSSDQA